MLEDLGKLTSDNGEIECLFITSDYVSLCNITVGSRNMSDTYVVKFVIAAVPFFIVED